MRICGEDGAWLCDVHRELPLVRWRMARAAHGATSSGASAFVGLWAAVGVYSRWGSVRLSMEGGERTGGSAEAQQRFWYSSTGEKIAHPGSPPPRRGGPGRWEPRGQGKKSTKYFSK